MPWIVLGGDYLPWMVLGGTIYSAMDGPGGLSAMDGPRGDYLQCHGWSGGPGILPWMVRGDHL